MFILRHTFFYSRSEAVKHCFQHRIGYRSNYLLYSKHIHTFKIHLNIKTLNAYLPLNSWLLIWLWLSLGTRKSTHFRSYEWSAVHKQKYLGIIAGPWILGLEICVKKEITNESAQMSKFSYSSLRRLIIYIWFIYDFLYNLYIYNFLI